MEVGALPTAAGTHSVITCWKMEAQSWDRKWDFPITVPTSSFLLKVP